ncbi:hypothetical protein YSA_04507 [Pseudomonas putida ND6]|uniref:Uncharacterized protein n=1 Tax=Pseudomonas putida ND6 TaxID=231023 RepID=I3UUP2_PSEPU|nr:hypothetical protein YSA_04507 [Pseudomonas putida ND6]
MLWALVAAQASVRGCAFMLVSANEGEILARWWRNFFAMIG